MSQVIGFVKAAAVIGFGDIRTKPKRAIGPFTPQVTISEEHTDELEITDQPVEQGARISDHSFKRPAEVVITAGWSNSPGSANFLGNLLGSVTGTVSGVQSLISGSDVDQVKQLYTDLLTLQASRELFRVYTGKRIYDNMLVQSLKTRTDKESENRLDIVAVLRQVIVVQTQVVALDAPASSQAQPETTSSTVLKGVKSLAPAPSYNTAAGNAVLNPAPRGDL